MSDNIEVKDCTTGYGYFIIDEFKGMFRVWQSTSHWGSLKAKQNVGEARTYEGALSIVKSYSGGTKLKIW